MRERAATREVQPLSPSIIWLVAGAPTTTLMLVVGYWTQALLRDYLTSPTRQLYEIAAMLPVISIGSFLVAFVAQVAAYTALIALTLVLLRLMGRVPLWPLLLASPLLGLLAWFGYEHFVPEYRFFLDEGPPYEYGLTLNKFLVAWSVQILVVLGFWWPLRSKAERARS